MRSKGFLCLLFSILIQLVWPAQGPSRGPVVLPDDGDANTEICFADPGRGAAIKFEFSSNHIFVPVCVNESTPLWFVLDTGSTLSVLNASVLSQTSLTRSGVKELSAIGGMVDAETIPGVNLRMQGVTVRNLTIAAMPLGPVEEIAGRRIDGILGGDFISKVVLEIDYFNRTISIFSPTSYKYTGAGEAIPIDINQKTPFASALIIGPGKREIPARLEIDTGSGRAVEFSARFLRDYKLPALLGRVVHEPSTPVPGGESADEIGRVSGLKLGNILMSDPVISFSQDTGGEMSVADYDGVMGGEFLRRLSLVLDYSRFRMYISPNQQIREPDDYDASGMKLIAEQPDFRTIKVKAVISGSPADQAGIRKGDILHALDKTPVSALKLEAVKAMLKQSGRSYRVELIRGARTFTVTLQLRRLI